MKDLTKKLESHFYNLDHEKFKKDWAEISSKCASEGLCLDEFLKCQKQGL